MFIIRVLFFIMFLSIQFCSSAQKTGIDETPKSIYKSYGSAKVHIDEDDEPKNYIPDYTMKHFISINIGSAFIGEIPVFYERNIKKYFNIQAGLGLTFDNLMYDIVVNGGHNFPFLISNTILDANFYRLTSVGPSVMIEPKYYFGEKNYEGFYIGLQCRFRQYNYTSSKYDFVVVQGSNTNENQYKEFDLGKTIKESRSVTDFLIELGGSHFFAKHFNYQYYVALGIRNNGFYSATMSNYSIINGTLMSYQLSESYSNLQNFAIAGGFRMGYVF